MHINKLILKGLVPFPDEVVTHFPSDMPIVAVCGENGAGKTTFFDAIPMAIYGKAPNRKGFYECFRGKDGLIDLEFDYLGKNFRVKRLINANSRSQKGYLYIDGQPVTEGNITELESVMLKHFPVSMDVFLASAFHAQNGKGQATDLNDGDKRSLLEQILGLSMFDNHHSLAQAELKRCQLEVETKERLISNISADDIDLNELRGRIEVLESEIESTDVLLKQFSINHQDLIERQANVKANAQQEVEVLRQHGLIKTQLEEAKTKLSDVETRLKNNIDNLINKRSEIEDAVSITEFHKAELFKLEEQKNAVIQQNAVDVEAFTVKQNQANAIVANCQKQKQEAFQQHQKALYDKEILAEQIQSLEKSIAQAEGQTSVLEQVPCKDTPMQGACQLLSNARSLKEKQYADTNQLATLKQQLSEIIIDESLLVQANAALEAAERAYQELSSQNPTRALQEKLASLDAEILVINQKINSLSDLVKLKEPLALANERVQQYQSEIDSLKTVIASHEASEAEWAQRANDCQNLQQSLEKIALELAGNEQSFMQANEKKAFCLKALSQKQAQIEQAQINQDKKNLIESERNEIQRRISLLQYLVEGFGPKGVRALKIDAAGPEISAIVNELLRECYDTRFTVQIETLKELATNKDELRECLRFIIIDEETGEKTDVENKSGGEQALIKEVISLGLGIYKSQTSGVEIKTLFRDECSAPLSEENTGRYIQMLRRAMTLGGFDQVLIVTHKKSAQNLADAKILIKEGQTQLICT